MYTTNFLLTITSFALLSTATPLSKRQTCNVFPWYINPQTASDCSAPQPSYDPTSGPAPGNGVTCQPLDPQNHASFVAAAVNIACADSGYPYDVILYSSGDCSDGGVVAGTGCYQAPDGKPFVMYSAVKKF